MPDIQVVFPDPCGERWDDMKPHGCNRHCGQCATTVHDLERLTASEVEAMLRAPGIRCVRARLDGSGEVQLRPGRSSARLIAVIGAGVGLLATSPAGLATAAPPHGEIVGVVADGDNTVTVSAQAGDGKTYRTRVRRNGQFRLKSLPPGAYQVSYSGGCVGQWTGDKIVVEPGKTSKTSATNVTDDCVIVGVMRLRGDDG